MARKKAEESKSDTGGWINTFADLMNLLLCFFVVLFSMSTVDADKYEALVTSLSSSVSIFDGGSAGVEEGAFVSSGTDQLVSISEYFKEFEKSGTSSEDSKEQQEQGNKNQELAENPISDEELVKKYKESMREKTEALYEEIVKKATEKNIVDIMNVNMDENYQYVKISLKGAILFDSGKADIKKDAKPILSRVSEILKTYSKQLIKIEGHTDNVPISSPKYANNMELSTARANSVFMYFVKTNKMKPEKLESAGRGEYTPADTNKTEKGRAKNRRIEIKVYPEG